MLSELFHIEIPSHRIVLNTIRIYKEVSGAELSRLTKYQPSTLVYILRSLKKKGFIKVSRVGNLVGSAGKPPTLWSLNPEMGYILGVEILPNEFRITVLDFACHVIHQEHQVGFKDLKGDKTAKITVSLINDVIKKLNLPKEKIIGVGVALPGLVDREKGFVHYSRRLSLNNVYLQTLLANNLNLPVEIINDANAGALGIWWHLDSAEPLPPNVVFLTLNEKIREMGAGFILNTNLYEGAQGTAGEIFVTLPSIIKLIEKGKKKFGEKQALIEFINEGGDASLLKIIECAKQNCRISNFILKSFSKYIIDEVIRIVEFLNPNLIVIGGDITEAKLLIYDYITQNVKKNLKNKFPTGVIVPEIRFSGTGIYSVSLGATSLFLRKMFL
ncbi:ROK family transcriptional regulator [candidate division KSB1 bacterium]|nr:ROK family transcriptional regulator [candidate division KSB1 bacterium]